MRFQSLLQYAGKVDLSAFCSFIQPHGNGERFFDRLILVESAVKFCVTGYHACKLVMFKTYISRIARDRDCLFVLFHIVQHQAKCILRHFYGICHIIAARIASLDIGKMDAVCSFFFRCEYCRICIFHILILLRIRYVCQMFFKDVSFATKEGYGSVPARSVNAHSA